MALFRLPGLHALLLEKIITKCAWKSYAHLQQTCRAMKEFIRANRNIRIFTHMGISCKAIWRNHEIRTYRWYAQERLSVSKLFTELEFPVSNHHHEVSVTLDPEDALRVAETFLTRFHTVILKVGNLQVNGDRTFEVLIPILEFLRSRSLTNLCCFRLIGSRKSYKAPPLRETLESLWNFTPTVVKEYAGDLGYVLKCLLDSDGTFCNFITAPNYVEIRFNRYIRTV